MEATNQEQMNHNASDEWQTEEELAEIQRKTMKHSGGLMAVMMFFVLLALILIYYWINTLKGGVVEIPQYLLPLHLGPVFIPYA